MKKLGLRMWIPLALAVLTFVPGVAAQVVHIADVEQLYGAVNDVANAGATLALSPGTYMLSATDPNGIPRPKGGRIEFQPDMSIVGVRGNRGAVVINAINLPESSFPAKSNGIATGPNAAVRMGLGKNALEWLTVRDAQSAQANIDSGLQPLDSAPTSIRIAHVDSTGSTRGLNILNFGPQTSGQTIEADVIDCRFFDNVLNLSEGIRMGNFQGAQGSTVNVRMIGNTSWGQKQGRLIVNNRAINSTVNVQSYHNWFYGNGGGTIIAGGLSSNDTRADGNTINFEAYGDRFVGNTGETDFDHGGLIALGMDNTSPASGGGSNNTVHVKVTDCWLADNNTVDLMGIGARSVPDLTAGFSQNNRVTIEIRGDGDGKKEGVVLFTDSLPAEPNTGNSVTVLRPTEDQ